ncbi:MAG TPA: hypothetical protein VM425_07160 [Myxococcota bacterium]|nr:hypothetical protein [Myxococcota bacterium]
MKSGRLVLAEAAAVLAMLSASACGGSGGNDVNHGAKAALVVTTDYQTGSYAAVDLEDHSVVKNIAVIHSDAVCRYDPLSGRPFIVSRLGADAVEVVDPETLAVAGEYSVGAGSNPQDIAPVSDSRAYVPRYGDKDLLVVNPESGAEVEKIDLSAYADADGVPEAAWAVAHKGKVYLTLHRLDNFTPTDHSSMLVIDGVSGAVEAEVNLTATSPYGKLRYNPFIDRIVLVEVGSFGVLDGGVEYFNPDDNTVGGLLVSEETLGGDLSDAVILSDTKGYAVVGVSQPDFSVITRVVSFNPSTGAKIADLSIGQGYDHAFIELTPDGLQLWVTDRNSATPGIRIFDTKDDQEITTEPIDTGLPPFMTCFIPD